MRRLPVLVRALDASLMPFAIPYLGVAWALWGDGDLVRAGGALADPTPLARWLCLGWIPCLGLAMAVFTLAARRGALAPWRTRAARIYAIAFVATAPLQLAAVEWSVHRLHGDEAACVGRLACARPTVPRATTAESEPRHEAEGLSEYGEGNEKLRERRIATQPGPSFRATPPPLPEPARRAAPEPVAPAPRPHAGAERGGGSESPAGAPSLGASLSPAPAAAPQASAAGEIRDASEAHANGRPRSRGSVHTPPGSAEPVRTGRWSFFAENGQKTAEGSYRDGERSGLWREWYEDGQPKLEASYCDGEPQSDLIRWHPNGEVAQRRDELRTEDGQVLWLEEWFYPDGGRQARSQLEDGELQGPSRAWHPSGGRSEAGTYSGGAKDGLWIYWDTEGETRGHEPWERGRLLGIPVAPPASAAAVD